MKNRFVQALLVVAFASTMTTYAVAPCMGAEQELNTTDVAAQDFITTINYRLYAGIASYMNEDLISITPNKNSIVTSFYEESKDELVESIELTPIEEEEKDIIPEMTQVGYTTTGVNVRTEPNTDCEVLDIYPLNTEIQYCTYDDDWVELLYNDEIVYMNSTYISDEKTVLSFTSYNMPMTTGFKSYMSYKSITVKNSPQYKLQQIAYTGDYGIRMYDNRYCVAIGTHFNTEIGTHIDLVLENGTVIPCVVADIKSNAHTDSSHIITVHSGCVSEFVIDPNALNSKAKRMGDISYCCDEWDSRVVEIRVY